MTDRDPEWVDALTPFIARGTESSGRLSGPPSQPPDTSPGWLIGVSIVAIACGMLIFALADGVLSAVGLAIVAVFNLIGFVGVVAQGVILGNRRIDHDRRRRSS